ncbi:hypothetical protein Tco_0370639 [Tanacetum coccineum]
MAMQAISLFKTGVNGGAGLMLITHDHMCAFVCWDLSVYEGYGVRMHSDNTKVSNGGEVQCFEGLCITMKASCNKKHRGFAKVNFSELMKSIEEYEKTLEARKQSIVGAGNLRTLKLDLKSINNGYGSLFVKISAY